jgi:UDP:flavonoid glycosyltransferase YjiC (YdhE family)
VEISGVRTVSLFPFLSALKLLRPFTNMPFPLLSIPFNILAAFALIYLLLRHPARRRLDAARKAAGLPGSMLAPAQKQAVCNIHASLEALEYPHVPYPRTVFAGPILNPVPVVAADTYPDLAAFLAQGRTVLVNMGSLFKYTPADTIAMAEAFVAARKELAGSGGLQVLWKLPDASGFQTLLDKHLGLPAQRRAWVRVEEWIEPPALAVLQHPNVAVFVHHGGASEALADSR